MDDEIKAELRRMSVMVRAPLDQSRAHIERTIRTLMKAKAGTALITAGNDIEAIVSAFVSAGVPELDARALVGTAASISFVEAFWRIVDCKLEYS